MTVREYIGARYVPLFMGEWDNTETYEPLSIVEYQGNTYTSRQYVPTGIEITNTAYWAVTGNFNAQVEQYREEVRALENIIPTSEFSSQNTVFDYVEKSNADVSKYGAKPNTTELDWNSIFASCIENGNGIYFPNGTWIIDGDFTIGACQFIVGESSILSFTHSDSHLTINGAFETRFFTMSGLRFDGNQIAQNAITFTFGNPGSINNCHFRDFVNTCITCEVLGLMCENCSFIDTSAVSDTINDFKMTAITCMTDNVITGCKFFGCKYNIKVNASTEITNCYFYGNCKNFKTNYGIFPNTGNSVKYTHISACEFDSIRYCFSSFECCNIIDCTFLWDSEVTTGINSIFYATSSNIAIDVTVDYCDFYTPPNTTEVDYNIKTFCSNSDHSSLNVNRYSSSKCVKHMRKAADDSHQFNITAGCKIGETGGDLNTQIIKLQSENNSQGTSSKRTVFKHEGSNLYIGLTSNMSNSRAYYDVPMITITNPIAVGNTDRTTLYLRGGIDTYTHIILNAIPYNMSSKLETAMPDSPDWTLNAYQRAANV